MLRLFFESKLNSLHHLNNAHVSKHEMLEEENTSLAMKFAKLQVDYDEIKLEHQALK